MPVVFDTTFLALLYGPFAKPPLDPKTKQPVSRAEDRIAFLVDGLSRAQTRIIIPTPALCELLCYAGDEAPNQVDIFTGSSRFILAPFDVRAAVEASQVLRSVIRSGNKRGKSAPSTPWQKVKFDRQIVAIAKTLSASHIYSDDEDIARYGVDSGLEVVTLADLPVPPPSQNQLPLHQSTPE
jgi:hypothetical protein